MEDVDLEQMKFSLQQLVDMVDITGMVWMAGSELDTVTLKVRDLFYNTPWHNNRIRCHEFEMDRQTEREAWIEVVANLLCKD